MEEIVKLKLKILEVLNALETVKNNKQRAAMIEQLIRLRNLLNGLEAQLAHFKEIQLDMGMD